jgi:DNA mismatch repair protein MutL
LLVIDQVAARERILFEQARLRLHNGRVPSQQLLFPELAELGPEPSLWIEQHRDTLATLGFALEPFGNHCWQLRGTPPELEPERALQVLQQIAAELAKGEAAEDPSDATARVYARYAAKVSPQELSREERDELVDDLFGSADPWHAPDGRTAVISITLAELARRFTNP